MICKVDGTWELEPSDIRTYNLVVAKLLQEKAMSNDKTMNVDKFVRYMYKEMLDGLEDEQKALAFTRHTPDAILLAGMADPTTREGLKAKGYKTEDVENLQTMFAASLQAVSNFVTPKADSSAANVSAQVKAATLAGSLQPQAAPTPTPDTDPIKEDGEFDLPYSPLTTTGNEQIEGREWYYGFIKKLKNLLPVVNGIGADGTITYPDAPNGVRISMVLGGIPKDQLYPDDQAMSDEDIERLTSDAMYAVVTDANGNKLYFNDKYEVTTSDQGKLIYFPTRTIPSFKVNEAGERQFNLEEQGGKTVQSIADRVKKGASIESVTREFNESYENLYKMKQHLRENKGKVLLLDITGIDNGTINYNKDARVSLNQVNNIDGYTLNTIGKRGRRYTNITFTNGATAPLVMKEFSRSLANKVADFIASDVYDADGKLLTPMDKLNTLKTFTRTSGEGMLAIDADNKFVLLGNEQVMMDDADLKSKIIDFLTREDKIVKESGEDIEYNNQLYFNSDNYKNNSPVDEFELIPRSEGGLQYKSNPKDFNKWIAENSFIPVVLDQNGNVRELNGYFKFAPNLKTINELTPKSVGFANPNPIATKTIEVNVENSSMVNFQSVDDAVTEAINNNLLGNEKLFSMRDDSVSATKSQIKKGKKWFDTTELTFKDANGKTVKKKLSDVIPYQVLFDVINSNGNVRAQFNKSGITLFNGSDYTTLYHEAWHGFTQLFLNSQQRQKLYDEVKALAKPIKYYNQDKAVWETMNSKDLDFSNKNHILYAEEFLADEYREYAKNRSAKTTTFKNIFKKIWEAIKAIFGKSTKSSIVSRYDNPVLEKAFNELYVGDLSNYTYNQANIQFDTLNSGINFLAPEEGKPSTMDISDSLDVAETLNYFVSNFIDGLNAGNGTNAYTINTLINNEFKKVALKHGLTNFKAYADNISKRLEGLEDGYLKLKLEKRLATWQNAIDNFGDIDNLENNKENGVIAFYNKRTGFLDMKGAATVKDTGEQTDEIDPDAPNQDTNRGAMGATDGTESTAFDRVDEAVMFTMASIYDRTESTPTNKEGLLFNSIGGIATADPRKVFNILSNKTEGIKDRTEMYTALQLAAGEKDRNGYIKPEARMIQQFISKMGKPGSGRMGSEILWNKVYKSLRNDRIRGMKLLTTRTPIDTKSKKKEYVVSIAVGVPDSGYKAILRKMDDSFKAIQKNPSPYKSKNRDGEVQLDLYALAAKYLPLTKGQIANMNPVDVLRDFGITITDNYKSTQKLRAQQIVTDLFDFRFRPLLQEKKETIKSIKDLTGNQDRVFDNMAKIESEADYQFSDYMIKNAEEESQSERSNPSSAGSVFSDLNKYEDYENLVANPATAHFDKNKNSYVKTSLIFKQLYGDDNGNLGKRKVFGKTGDKPALEFVNLLGTQILENDAVSQVNKLLEGIKSSDSAEETAYIRDLFFYVLHGASEAYRHADKSMAYIAKLTGHPSLRHYISPELFTQENKLYGNNGRQAANKVMYGYIASELERINRVKHGVFATGEKPKDVILYTKKGGGYVTYEDTGSVFTVFDGILSDELKKELIADRSIGTVEQFMARVNSDIDLKSKLDESLDAYFNSEIAKDKAKFNSFGLNGKSGQISSLGRSFKYKVEGDALFDASIELFVYSSFIHKFEMNTLIYGDPATYNLPKDEHMKRVAAFFASGPIPVTDDAMEQELQKNPGGYADSAYYKKSNLAKPVPGMQEKRILATSVLEDALEESAYYRMMVDYAVKNAGWTKEYAEERYASYKDMKSADAQAWITFDAYRALEYRLGNWGPVKEQLYWDIINGKKIDQERLELFFPVKKYQYAGAIGTQNFALNGFHKYSVMPLIPTIIEGRPLEALHNKMIAEGVAYSVMHSGSKLASIGNDGKLSLFYTEQKGSNTPAFTDPNYKFNKTPIFLDYLKEQVATHDEFKGNIKFPSQVRKLILSGLMELGVPVEFKEGTTDYERKLAWEKLPKTKKLEYPSYRLQEEYKTNVDKMISVAVDKLKMELGYTESEGINMQNLADFVKKNLEKRDVSEYDLKFIQLADDGTLYLPLDLSNDPAKIEKLLSSIVNKRIVDQMSSGDQYIQGSNIGFEKFKKPTEADLAKYLVKSGTNNNNLRFYEPILDKDGNTIGIRPMQVKVALHGDFKKLLQHKDKQGKPIGTIARLNQLIKDDEWLALGNNRRMITLTGVRIPTQGVNSMEVMEIEEFLPEVAGNIMIVPSDIVAKSGGDFDIDKLVTLIPPIEFNNGVVELKGYTETSKSLADIKAEEKTIKDELKELRQQFKDPIYSKAFAELQSTKGDSKLFILKSDLTPEMLDELTPDTKDGQRVKGGEYYGIKILGDYYTHDTIKSSNGENLDIIVVDNAEDAEKQYEAYVAGGAKNFTGVSRMTTEERVKAAKRSSGFFKKMSGLKSKLAALQREENSFDPSAYQNNLMQSMVNILLRPDNYMNLTLPNDTTLYEGENGPVEKFRAVNVKGSKSKSPTRIMQNSYNIEKALAMSLGKSSIGLLATGNTFFSLYKSVGLTMNTLTKVYNKKGGFVEVPQRLLVKHNNINGEISLSHTRDANNEHDIAELISQLMNGYLDVAKKTWVIDINASKEFEPQLEFLLLSGVPVMDAVGLLSQPLVREYLGLIKKYTDPQRVAAGEIDGTQMAAFKAAKEMLSNLDILGGEFISNMDIAQVAAEQLKGVDPVTFKDLEEGALGKKDDEFNKNMFLHFLEVTNMAKGNSELKRNLNFDTDKKQSLFEISQKEENIKAMSDKFSKSSIDRLINDTVLKNFKTYEIMEATISAMLPLRGIRNVNTYLANLVRDMQGDQSKKQKYYNGFINDLTSYMYRNYLSVFDRNADTYKGETIDYTVDIVKQPLLKFGAFVGVDKAGNPKLYVDTNSIENDFKTGNYSKLGYGGGKVVLENDKWVMKPGELALLPEGTFVGYPRNKALSLYTNFVYEREFLRFAFPYENINKNPEFLLFANRRARDLNKQDQPRFYEEFIRNKAMSNVQMDQGFFVTDRAKGLVSKAQQLMDILEAYPDLERLYPVLGALKKTMVKDKEFITFNTNLKDPDILTSYTSQMSKLMDQGESKADNDRENAMISRFFETLPLVGFQQAGNNAKSDLYIGSLFDQTTTGIPELLQPALDKFIADLKGPNSKAILDSFNEKYKLKADSFGAVKYVNYTADPKVSVDEATDPKTTVGHSGGAAGADSKWDEIGQEFGPIAFKHYYTGERSPENAPKGNVDITDTPLAVEGATKVAQAAAKMWGYKYKTMKDQRLIRNWAQVANSQAVYAIAPIGKEGDYWGEDMKKKPEDRRVLAKEAVQGGTGYAVEMAIQAGKPVYVYNDPNAKAASHLPKGWYTWDGTSFVAIDTPMLAKNFAAIGSRNMSAEAEQAIRDVYTQAFGTSSAEPQAKVQTVSEDYGVVIAETDPSATKTQEFVNLIQPQIKAQAYKENASTTANDMFMYGLRWTRKSGAKVPLVNKSYANGGLPTTDAKAKDGYVYDTVDQNGNPLAPVSDLQPIMEEIQKTLGIDMSNYDAVIGNIYLPGQRIATHRDTTESLSARNYPVVVYTIGNMSGISIYENEKNPGSASFASDKRTTIPTQNGSIYTFGMDGKGRFEMAHDTPGMKREQKFPPITLPDGTTVENYTITLTFRRAADLEPGMAASPAKLSTGSSSAVKEGVQDVFEIKPELAQIGTPEQYSQWLDYLTTSGKLAGTTVNNILYHGTYQDFDQFSKEKLGVTTGLGKITDNKRGETFDYDSANAFFFTDNKTNAISYALLGRGNYLGSIETALSRLTFARKDAQESIDFLKTVPYFNNLIETAKAEGKTKEEILDLLKEERRKLAGKYKSRDAQGFTNTINNVKLANEVLTRFLSQIDRFKANDPGIEGMYGTFEEYNDGNASGTHRIFYKPNEGGYEFVDFEKGITDASRRFVSSMSKSDIKKFLEDAIEADNKVLAKNEKEMKSKGYKKKTIPVLLNLKNPLVHDYEGSSFPDSYKETKYPTAYLAARQVANAMKEGKDGVVYENIVDPLKSNSYGIFETDQIYLLGSEEDKAGFKNFISTQAPAQKFDQSAPAATGTVSNKPRFVKEQNSLVRAVDYETGSILDPALIYNDKQFNTKVSVVDPKTRMETTQVQYKLDDTKINELAADHPDHLFVFDDFWPTTSGLRDTLARNNTRRAWAQFAPQGISFGLSTESNNNSQFKSLDANYDKLVPMIDAQIEALKEKRSQGKKIVFPATGVGQSLMGFTYKDGELIKGKERPAPNLFVYLSKRLLQEFGFQNPTFDEITSRTGFNKELLQGLSNDRVLEGDIFAFPGVPVITTNLGGVHGAGLAQLAAAKGLITKGDGAFKVSDTVVQLPVKKKWSDDMTMNNNMELLKSSLRSLILAAKSRPETTYLLPLAGLGHGEGSVEEILPLLIKTAEASSNIRLVLPSADVNLGRQGTVRKDSTRENMPKIKEMIAKSTLMRATTEEYIQDFYVDAGLQYVTDSQVLEQIKNCKGT